MSGTAAAVGRCGALCRIHRIACGGRSFTRVHPRAMNLHRNDHPPTTANPFQFLFNKNNSAHNYRVDNTGHTHTAPTGGLSKLSSPALTPASQRARCRWRTAAAAPMVSAWISLSAHDPSFSSTTSPRVYVQLLADLRPAS